MRCEQKHKGDNFCPRKADIWVYIINPLTGGEKALCHKCLALQLMQYGSEDKIKWLESIGQK